ncbi:MAG: hypothetical protein JNM13_02345 [Hyphomicrobiaceae bacterium]|nr:hypothetical protein [Hyphomicrobiaceae bacterium]
MAGTQPVAAARRARRRPGFSLLRASLAERLAIAAVATAGIWGGVFWAIA